MAFFYLYIYFNDMNDKGQKYRGLVFNWIDNLVGNGAKFSFNVLVSVVGGLLFSFGVWNSPFALAIFGVVSPLLFTFCLYSLIPFLSELPDSPIPKIFATKFGISMAMLFDMVIVIALALLIQFDVIDYLFIRLLLTVIFPALMLLILRVVYLQIKERNS